MQPKDRRTRLQSATLARGRMFLKADFGWLPGFPVGAEGDSVLWMSVPGEGDRQPEQVKLSRGHLRRASYTWSKLVHRFPRVLPRLVDDADWWNQGIANVLGWLKGAIHRHESTPASLFEEENAYAHHAVQSARDLADRTPALRPFLNALSWIHYLAPEHLAKALRWTQKNAGLVVYLGDVLEGTDRLVDPFVLCELSRRDGQNLVQPLMDLLGDRRSMTCSTTGEDAFLDQLRHLIRRRRTGEVGEMPADPPGELGRHIRGLARWVVAQDRGTRRRALHLFGLLLTPAMFDLWEQWWGRAKQLAQQIRKRPTGGPSRTAKADSKSTNLAIDQLAQQIPPRVHIDSVVHYVQHASVAGRKPFHKALVANLEMLPATMNGALVRCAFLGHWGCLARMYERDLPPFLRGLQRHYWRCTADDEVRLLGPWQNVLEGWEAARPGWYWGLAFAMLEEGKNRSEWKAAFEALTLCVMSRAKPIDPADGEMIWTLSRSSSTAEQVRDRYCAVVEAKRGTTYLEESLVACACKFSKNARDFAEVYHALAKCRELAPEDRRSLLHVHDRLQRAGWNGVVPATILDGKTHEIVGVLRMMNVCREVSVDLAPPAKPERPMIPEWASEYPRDVRRALTVMSSATPNAGAVAARLLKRLFPSARRLQNEIQAIQERLQEHPHDDRLRARLENLVKRQAQPSSLQRSRVKKAIERIERATHSAVLSAWNEGLERQLSSALPRILETDRDVSLLLTPQHALGLCAALRLKGAEKALAIRLYRLRCGPPPWHMHDHSVNQSFIRKLQRQGIGMTPWVESPSPWQWVAKNGATLTVYFEDDPLEIFQMGSYFNTCLSPGDCNFSSVFSNAADVNKKVLFARDHRNVVVGRCLFALSDNGGVLVFHPYCHGSHFGFGDYVKGFAVKLATRMGTRVIPRGAVSNLVSSDWYDDGPLDLCDRIACLRDGSEFRAALETVEPHDLRNLVTAALDPMPINSLSLSQLLALPEFDSRPELVLPLLPDIDKADGLSAELWQRLAVRLHRAGTTQVAHRIVERRLVPLAIERHAEFQWLNTSIALTVAEIMPSVAIRLIRATRDRGVRRDSDETEGDRKRVLGTAYQQLGREKKAAALLAKTKSKR